MLGSVLRWVTPPLGRSGADYSLVLGWTGSLVCWRFVGLVLQHSILSGDAPLQRSTITGARKFLSGGVVCYSYFLFFHRITQSWSHILIIVPLFLLHLVISCLPLLGGYGALTHGVYQHLTLNGT